MPARSPVRLGVIGAGWFASRRHCPDIVGHPEAELKALCRRDPEKLAAMARAFQVEHTFTDYGDLLGSGLLDGVVICSPHDLHYEHARAALEQGLPVLLEKPITTDPRQGRELVALAAQKQLALIVAQNPPYWSHCRLLRDQIRKGVLGELEAASIHWVGNAKGVLGLEPLPQDLPGIVPPTLFRGDPRQNGGGFLMDGGSHLICELVWCTGLKVVELTAQMDDPAFDLRAVLTLRLENGALATLGNIADSSLRAKRQHSLYCGSKGTARARGFPFEIWLERGGALEHFSETQLAAPPTPVGNFVDCLLGRGRPEIDGDTAVHVVEIVRAAQEAAARGERVKL
jgi:predicted dehydrogenase